MVPCSVLESIPQHFAYKVDTFGRPFLSLFLLSVSASQNVGKHVSHSSLYHVQKKIKK